MINVKDYEDTFTQLGMSSDEVDNVIRFFETLAQIAIENNILNREK